MYWVKLRRNSAFFIPWAAQISFLPPSMSLWWTKLAHRKEAQSSVYFVFWNHLHTYPHKAALPPNSSFLLEEGLDVALTGLADVESKARRQRAGSGSSVPPIHSPNTILLTPAHHHPLFLSFSHQCFLPVFPSNYSGNTVPPQPCRQSWLPGWTNGWALNSRTE